MPLVSVTDAPYMRDFYHWVLRGHCENGYPPVDVGFEWQAEGGPINSMNLGYPKSPFWYELGNDPNYLSSRTIYYYRAWQEYEIAPDRIKVYGEWVQFTSINPMCNGFVNFEAKKMMRKYYSYHGMTMLCPIQPESNPYQCVPALAPGVFWILVYDWSGRYDGIKIVKWSITDWLPSSEDDPCPDHFPDGKKRLVFWEYDIHHIVQEPPMQSLYTDGLNCEQVTWKMYKDYYYKKSYNTYYYLSSWIMGISWPWYGSRIRVWKSSTGEYPGYLPI